MFNITVCHVPVPFLPTTHTYKHTHTQQTLVFLCSGWRPFDRQHWIRGEFYQEMWRTNNSDNKLTEFMFIFIKGRPLCHAAQLMPSCVCVCVWEGVYSLLWVQTTLFPFTLSPLTYFPTDGPDGFTLGPSWLAWRVITWEFQPALITLSAALKNTAPLTEQIVNKTLSENHQTVN